MSWPKVLVLDAEPVNLLARVQGSSDPRAVMLAEAIVATRSLIIVPTVVLAELLRGRPEDAAIHAWVNRGLKSQQVTLVDTGSDLAAGVGAVLGYAGAGSDDAIDAHVVAVARATPNSKIMTVDRSDLVRLAAPWPNIEVLAI